MQAIVARANDTTPAVIDIPKPSIQEGEVLVKTHRVGIDGTDHAVISGSHGGFPQGDDYLVLGHEAVGVVEESKHEAYDPGDVVVPTVRRARADSPSGDRPLDMAGPGEYVERGIQGAHGFMAEYFTVSGEHLVALPAGLAWAGFLVEPISNVEKALEMVTRARQDFWSPEAAFVLGNGPLGLLTAARLSVTPECDRWYCLGRRDRPDPTINTIERLGGTYIDSRETPVESVPNQYELMDLVVEATGFHRHAFETVKALAPNGVGALLGIPEQGEATLPTAELHRSIVMENKVLLGSVNSGPSHYRTAIETLENYPDWFPESLNSDIYHVDEIEEAFNSHPLKTAVQFAEI